MPGIEKYTVAQLRTMAKEKGLSGYSKMVKADLIQLLEKSNRRPNLVKKVTPKKQGIEKYTVTQLRTMAKEKGLTGYSKMVKADLIQLLEKSNRRPSPVKKQEYPSDKIFNPETGRKYVPKPMKPMQPRQINTNVSVLHMAKPRTSIIKPGYVYPSGKHKYTLIALLYLKWKYPKDCIVTPVPKTISDINNINILSLHIAYHKHIRKYDIYVYPGFISQFKSCIKSSSRFIVIYLTMTYTVEHSHANMLIYDKKTKEMERFEPHGYNERYEKEMPKTDEELQAFFNREFGSRTVKKIIPPLDFCPRINVQILENMADKKLPGERGFCATWAVWYADTRLSNPNKTREQVVRMAIDKIKNDYSNFLNFIRSYAEFFDEMCKKIDFTGILDSTETPLGLIDNIYAAHLMAYD